MRMIFAGACALAMAGCLENPYPDTRLGMEKNAKRARWQSSWETVSELELRLTRKPGGLLSVEGRGTPCDSAEFVLYVTDYVSNGTPSLGSPLPNRIEYHGVIRHPGAAFTPIADIPDATDGDDLRDWNAGVILLKAAGGGNASAGGWGGVYAGTCNDPDYHSRPGKLRGYIDATGAFNFRCFSSDRDPGSVTTGKLGTDSLITFAQHHPFGGWGWVSDTTEGLRFARNGDSLAATFHFAGWNGVTDSNRVEARRLEPR